MKHAHAYDSYVLLEQNWIKKITTLKLLRNFTGFSPNSTTAGIKFQKFKNLEKKDKRPIFNLEEV